MKKTLTINLSGVVFHVEEDAYEKLQEYLDDIRDHFGKLDDVDEILEDIEANMAEKLNGKVLRKNKIITIKEVDELIKITGTVDDFEEVLSDEDSMNYDKPKKKSRPKRLYRDTDDVVIAGVCSGLAAYFGIDTVIVRVAFVLSIFLGGTGILLYIILWIVMPEAETPKQKLEMSGNPITLDTINSLYEKLKKNEKNEKVISDIFLFPFRLFKSIINFLVNFMKKLYPIISLIIGALIITVSAFSILAISFVGAVAIFNINAIYLTFGLYVVDIIPFYLYCILVVSAWMLLFIPLLFTLLIGITIGRRQKSFNLPVVVMLLIVWGVSIISFGVIGIKAGINLKSHVNNEKFVGITSRFLEFKDFDEIVVSNNLLLTISKSEDFQIVSSGAPRDLDRLLITVKDRRLYISTKEEVAYHLFPANELMDVSINLPELNAYLGENNTKAALYGFEEGNFDVDLLDNATLEIREGGFNNIDIDLRGNSEMIISNNRIENLKFNSIKVNAHDNSELKALEYPVLNAVVDMTGNAKVETMVLNDLKVNGSESSSLLYSGEPIIIKNLRGNSEVIKFE